MGKRRIAISSALLGCLLLAGCAGGGNQVSAGTSLAAATPAQIIERVPGGRPGVDYDPGIIEVMYRPDAVLPAQLRGPVDARLLPADERPNPILRQNPGYAEISEAIATRFGLDIRHEAYIPGFNWAAFAVPAGVDGAAAVQGISTEFGSVAATVGFSGIGHAGFVPNDPDFMASTSSSGVQWGQRRINCASAWDYTSGDPDLVIAVVDTGITMLHEELNGQILDPQIYYPDSHLDIANDDNTIEDLHGHGTAVAGVIAAKTNNANTVAGIAYTCPIMPVKIANSDSGSIANMLVGCVLAAQLGAKVINMSWYGSGVSVEFQAALAVIQANEQLVVVCAGNNSSDNPSVPGRYDQCLSVGATDQYDARCDFSNYGPEVDIAAPGVDLKVLTHTGLYRDWWGTSFSAPMVAAGAALLWSHAPELSLEEVRGILQGTGPEIPTFTNSEVRRLDLGTALTAIPYIEAPALDRLIYSGSADLTPVPTGDVASVELYVNDELAGTLITAPWTFNVDLSGFDFETVDLEFRAVGTAITASDTVTLLVDNLGPMLAVTEPFSVPPFAAVGYDARQLSAARLAGLKQLDAGAWTAADVAANGPAWWNNGSGGSIGWGMRLTELGNNYGAFETDALVTRRIDLGSALSAALAYATRYNIEIGALAHDYGRVLVTTDDGLSVTPLLNGATPVAYHGYTADFLQESCDLADWLGQEVRFIFLFESDATGSGEQAGQQAGWWIDELAISGEWVALTSVTTAADGVPGAVGGVTALTAAPAEPYYADQVEYWLDFAPLGVLDTYDIEQTSAAAPFGTEFDLSGALELPNQVAILRATPVASDTSTGAPVTAEVYLFNHLGDTNADGVVDALDTAGYPALLGLTSADAGYVPFFDSDLDGTIRDNDAGAVGYFYTGE
ncbi:S8 family serine peptidase [bacterium]|nr:S8 family serine peptidase [bacterium]